MLEQNAVKLDEIQGADKNQYSPLLVQWLKVNGLELFAPRHTSSIKLLCG